MTTQNKHHSVYNDLSTAEKRLVMINGSGPGAGAEKAKGEPEVAEQWRGVDAMAKFSNNIKNTLNDLAKEAYPNNSSQQEKYAKQIEQSLINHLAEGKTLEELWEHLDTEGCTVTAILQGFLNFYKIVEGKRDKINIDEFFGQPAQYPSTLQMDQEYEQKREALLPETRSNLKNFLDELMASLPPDVDLPQYPS